MCGVVLALGLALASVEPGRSEVHAASPYLNGLEPVTSAAGFTHPGVFLNLPELEFVREKVAAGAEPWTSVYNYILAPAQTSLVTKTPNWTRFADASDNTQACDPASAEGCVLDCRGSLVDTCKLELSREITSAYTNALLYYYSGGTESYAQNAVKMLNNWGRVFKGIVTDGANQRDSILLSAWAAETIPRAAEIIRYTYTPTAGNAAFDVDAFSSMLSTVLLPQFEASRLQSQSVSNNWRTSVVDGLMNISVFLDDRALYNRALGMWQEQTPAYIYLTSDGARANPFPDGLYATPVAQDCYWISGYSDACKTTPKALPGLIYQNGQNAEVCRDFWHSSAGMSGIINAAETAHLQGDDLYGQQQTRIKSGLSYMLQLEQTFTTAGYPSDFCAGAATYGSAGNNGDTFPTELDLRQVLADIVAYNHYATRKGQSFPTLSIPGYSDSYPNDDPVATFIVATQASSTNDYFGFITAWQILTHYGVGNGVTLGASTDDNSSDDDASGGIPGVPNTGSFLRLNNPIIVAVVGLAVAVGVAVVARRLTRRG